MNSDRLTIEIELFGNKTVLCERDAATSLSWQDKIQECKDGIEFLFLLVAMLSDGLAMNKKSLPSRFLFWKYKKVIIWNTRFEPHYLLNNISYTKLKELCNQVAKLESWSFDWSALNGKKKTSKNNQGQKSADFIPKD